MHMMHYALTSYASVVLKRHDAAFTQFFNYIPFEDRRDLRSSPVFGFSELFPSEL